MVLGKYVYLPLLFKRVLICFGHFAGWSLEQGVMGYTLIIGRDHDLCCRLVRKFLLSHGHQIMYLQEDGLFPGLRFAWNLSMGESSGTLGVGTQTIGFDEIDGVLARFSGVATSPEDFATKDRQYHLSSEWHALMRGYIESLPCPVIHRCRPELWYKSLLSASELLAVVPHVKFRLPRTLATTAFEEATAFFDQCRRPRKASALPKC